MAWASGGLSLDGGGQTGHLKWGCDDWIERVFVGDGVQFNHSYADVFEPLPVAQVVGQQGIETAIALLGVLL